MKPPGSRPGVTSCAIMPTTSPKTIHDRIPMVVPPLETRSLQAEGPQAYLQNRLRMESAAVGERATARERVGTAELRRPRRNGTRASTAPEPRERSAPAQRRVGERGGESEGRSPSD